MGDDAVQTGKARLTAPRAWRFWVAAAVSVAVSFGGGAWYWWHARQSVPSAVGAGLSAAQKRALLAYFPEASAQQHFEISVSTLDQWWQHDRPLVMIDVRSPFGPHGYQAGHIPGSYNIPWPDLGQELTARRRTTRWLAFATERGTKANAPVTFFPLPRTVPVVLISRDGDRAQMATALLRLLGYRAWALKDGIALWNPREDIWPSARAGMGPDLPLAKNGRVRRWPSPGRPHPVRLPASARTWVQTFFDADSGRPRLGFQGGWTMLPETLEAALNQPHPPLVIDLRQPAQYRRGHIPGSVNVPYADLGRVLPHLSPRRRIVLVSASLQRAAQANAVLRLLGYRSDVLQQGLVNWNPAFGQVGPAARDPLIQGPWPTHRPKPRGLGARRLKHPDGDNRGEGQLHDVGRGGGHDLDVRRF